MRTVQRLGAGEAKPFVHHGSARRIRVLVLRPSTLNMTQRLQAALLLILGSMAGLWAQNANSRWWAWPENPDPQSVERGRARFAKSCAGCHGEKATGGTHGPNLIRARVVRKDVDGSSVASLVRAGIPGRGMP